MIEIRVVQPNELKSWWQFVKPGLETILKKSPEDWIPEDVYAQCLCSNAVLWVLVEQSRPLGFWVLIPRGELVHVWCAYTPYHVLDTGMKMFLDAVRNANAKKVSFDSYRKGWDKVARKYGFTPRTWVKEL